DMKHTLLLFLLLCTYLNTAFSQTDTLAKSKNQLDLYPILFYLPETSLGFGAAGVYTYRFKGESPDSRPSQAQTVLSYTLKKQILLYLYGETYIDNEKWWIRSELGYYKYFYDFFGVGNENPTDFVETFEVSFPRARFDVQYLVAPKLYAGIRYWFDDYNLLSVEDDGLLASGAIAGGNSSLISGFGGMLTFDNRDNIFVPSKGWFIQGISFFNNKAFGSNFNFNRYELDVATYIATRPRQVLALNFYVGTITGTAPFNELLFLGGRRRARGYYEGRFRDNNMLLAQAEYRFPLFWRLGGVVFANYGGVAPTVSAYQIENFRWTAGAGLRFLLNKEEGVNLRFDIGFAPESFAFYFTVGEAF
ncbi:MAG: BamA/TamA family outer membrane protein, partial [Bacteroidota bacterium]